MKIKTIRLLFGMSRGQLLHYGQKRLNFASLQTILFVWGVGGLGRGLTIQAKNYQKPMVSKALQVKVAQAATQNQVEKIKKTISTVVYHLSRQSKCNLESLLRNTNMKKSAHLKTTTPNKKLSHKSVAANTNQKHSRMTTHHKGICRPGSTG